MSNIDKQMSIESKDDSTSSSRPSLFGKGRKRGRTQFDSFIRNVDTIHTAKSELDIYLEENVHLYNEDIDLSFDVLEW